MIEDCPLLAPLVEAGDAQVIWAKIEGHKRAFGLHMRRGHIAIRSGFVFPVIDGKTSIPNFEEQSPAKYVEVRQEPLREVGELSSAIFVPGALNYYHFLAFNLAPIALIAAALPIFGAPKTPPVLAMSRGLPPGARDLVRRLLPQFAGGREVPIVEVPEGDYAVRDLLFRIKPSPALTLTAVRIVQRLVFAEAGLADPALELGAIKLFVPRYGGINGRNLANQDDVRRWAEARGYTTVDPGTLPMEQQIILFARASHIIGVEGAAMANLLFASNAVTVVILGNPMIREETFYSRFSKSANFALHTILGQFVDPERPSRSADYTVPLDALVAGCAHLDL